MKFAVITPAFQPFIRSNPYFLALGLAEAGHEVHLVSSRGRAPRDTGFRIREEAESERLPFAVRYVPFLTNVEDNVISRSPAPYLDDRYDALLLQEDYPVICQSASRWAHRRGIPTVLSTERYYYPSRAAPRLALKLLDHTLHRSLWRRSTAITFHCRAAQPFFERIGAPPEKFHYLSAGIDARGFAEGSRRVPSERFGPDDGRFRFLSVSRFVPHKGLPVLLEAFAAVVRELPQAQLVLVGRGPMENGLRAQSRRLGIDAHLLFDERQLPNEEMPVVYRSVHAYVQPSVVEPFGAAVAEAMACGLPVVGSAVGGIADLVDPGVTGLLVPPADPSRLATALASLVRAPERANEMGRAGRERALTRCDYRELARRYPPLIDEGTRGAPRA